MSYTDNEVDHFMKNPSCTTPTIGLTPSPSPLLTDSTQRNRDEENLSALIVESLMFFGENPSQNGASEKSAQLTAHLESEPNEQLECQSFVELSGPKTLIDLSANSQQFSDDPAKQEQHPQAASSDTTPLVVLTEVEPPNTTSVADITNDAPLQVRRGSKRPPTALASSGSAGEEPSPRRKRTLDSMPVWGNIELPIKNKPPPLRSLPRKQTIDKAKESQTAGLGTNQTEKDTDSAGSTPDSTGGKLTAGPLPAEKVAPTGSVGTETSAASSRKGRGRSQTSKPRSTKGKEITKVPAGAEESRPAPLQKAEVKVGVNAEGTTVFTILPGVTPNKPAAPTNSPMPVKPTTTRTRKAPTPKATAKKTSSADKGKASSKKKDPFCIDSIVQRFIQTANSKKVNSS